MIELKNFNIALGKKYVVNNITASFGGNNVIIGPNGAGKTMLLKGMLGLVDYTGNCEINGNESSSIRNMVNTSFNLPEIYRLTRNVKDIVTIYSELKGKDVSTVYTVLDEFNLKGILDKNIDELSTGQEKLLCNILALSCGARTILLDEPFDNIDYGRRIKLLEWFNKLDAEIIMNTHEFEILKQMKNYGLYFLIDGIMSPEFSTSQIEKLYLNQELNDDSLWDIKNGKHTFSITENDGEIRLIDLPGFDYITGDGL